MIPLNESLSAIILAMMYFGDVVFAISGALTAARHGMDIFGFVRRGPGGATMAQFADFRFQVSTTEFDMLGRSRP